MSNVFGMYKYKLQLPFYALCIRQNFYIPLITSGHVWYVILSFGFFFQFGRFYKML